MNKDAMQAYHQVGISSANYANPHQLILMLMDGALERVAKAKGAILQKALAEKGKHLSNTIMIISGLNDCLDMDAGGELSKNLSELYDYMRRRLLQANLDNDPDVLDEVAYLLNEIRSAWVAIPRPVQEAHGKNMYRQVAQALAD